LLRVLSSLSPRSCFAWLGVAYPLIVGCAPTYRSVYEGDVRFEHCYRVDEERHVPIHDKLQCWREWTRRYHYGQSRDRLGYALARERTLAQAMAAGELAAPRGAMGTAQRSLPQPISAYVPPPQTMTPASASSEASASNGAHSGPPAAADRGAIQVAPSAERSFLAAERPAAASPLADAPGASCAGACGKTWVLCKQPCKGESCRSTCDEQYRGCMRACY
jgi:hypothetical protein